MNRTLLLTAATAAFALVPVMLSAPTLKYPTPPKNDTVDDYHGTRVADPYRILEDADAPETKKFVEEENQVTFSYLHSLPGYERFKEDLTGLWNYERFTPYDQAGRYLFFGQNSGLQNQSVLYVKDSMTGKPRELLDPNTYRKDGTAALTVTEPSWDGKLLGYGVAQAGSDWNEYHVRDVATGRDLSDKLDWIKFSGFAWLRDGSGFYYARYPQPAAAELLTVAARDSKVYFHKLGTPQSDDPLIYERPEHPVWETTAQATEEGRYLILNIYPGVPGQSLIAFRDLSDPHAKTIDLVSEPAHDYSVLEAVGNLLYVRTNDGAPRGRVITMNLEHPDREHWHEVIPEQTETLENAWIAGGKLVLAYMKDAHSAAKLASLDGKQVQEIPLPGLGTAHWASLRKSDAQAFFNFVSFADPGAEYRLDLKTAKLDLVRKTNVHFNPGDYETIQVFYKSKDGTRVPMFLTYKKGMQRNGHNPTLLYAYGGFDISETPNFQPFFIEWMNMGGIYAMANLRGGGEYGEAWHQAGMRDKKQNVFDDFISAGEYLVAQNYTSTPKLAIFGGSNGGLLIGAVLNQRPELFGAAMPAVGVMDMLRFQKFGYGGSWMGEYGDPENPADFKVIYAYSPLHNVRKADYPPTLITTSDHDDRVMPGHSLKYAAALQQAQQGSAPILIRVETRAGHGAGKPTSKVIDEYADRLTFLSSALKIELSGGSAHGSQ